MKENVAYLLGIVAGVAAVGIICWVKKPFPCPKAVARD